MKNKLKITATGDSLFVADIPSEYDADMAVISEYIAKGEVRITNLETNISKFGDFPGAYSGGTWLNVEPEDFDDLTKYGFNYYGTANNHCMDYSYHALLSTIDELDKYCDIVVECEKNGKRYKRKSHYQAILDMANKDRRVTV